MKPGAACSGSMSDRSAWTISAARRGGATIVRTTWTMADAMASVCHDAVDESGTGR